MSDIVYLLDSRHPSDITLRITMGGGMVNTGKVMKDLAVGDNVVLVYKGLVLGSAAVLSIQKRQRAGQEVAHGVVGPLSTAQRKLLLKLGPEINARGGAYLR